MAMSELSFEARTGTGKSVTRKIRSGGKAPGVLYSGGTGAVSVMFHPTELSKALRGRTWSAMLFRVKSDDQKVNGKTVRLKEWQIHPLSRAWLHADFMEVDLSKKLKVKVPLRFIGKAKGLADGGVLQPIHREIQLSVTPTNIPDFIEVDVTELTEFHPLHFKDVKLSNEFELVNNPEDAIVTITKVAEEVIAAPVVAAEATTAEGAAATPAEGAAAGAKAGDAGKAPAGGAAGAKAPAGGKPGKDK